MKVFGWSNSAPNVRTRSGYGIRIENHSRPLFLPEIFRTTCPELRSLAIGRWMLQQGVTPWVKG